MTSRNKNKKSGMVDCLPLLWDELRENAPSGFINEHGKLLIENIQREWIKNKISGPAPTRVTISKLFCDKKPHQKRIVDGFCRLIFKCSYDTWVDDNQLRIKSASNMTTEEESINLKDKSDIFLKANHGKHKKMNKIWQSTYQHYHSIEHQDEWITEEVIIEENHTSKISIISRENPIDCNYICEGEKINESYVIGTWKSWKPESPIAFGSGTFILTLTSTSTIMYGYFTAPRGAIERIYGAWVLAQTKEGLVEGKSLLKKFTLDIDG